MFSFLKKDKFRQLKKKASASYAEYLDVQLQRSVSKGKNRTSLEEERKTYLVNLLSSKLNLKSLKNALVIGCRDSKELDLLEAAGVTQVLGIDLFSRDSRVAVMDMHDIQYPDHHFDLIYASHSLEHAFDSNKVISEIVRVAKGAGAVLIEVPINYKTTNADIQDFQNGNHLISLFREYVPNLHVLHAEDISKDSNHNFCGTDATRIIIKFSKQ